MPNLSLNKRKIRKSIPGILLVILTLSLMFYFKQNKGDIGEIVSKGTDDLNSLYTENLKPLLFGTDLHSTKPYRLIKKKIKS